MSFDLQHYIETQIPWSKKTFGKGMRTEGLCRHIQTELDEIRENPTDLEEFIDVIILALDGAWRAGYSSGEIVESLISKQKKNFEREWLIPESDEDPSFHIK